MKRFKVKKLFETIYQPKILVYDIETAGVNALNADLGYIINFGYIWLDDFIVGKKPTVLSICDFPEFKKDPHNDLPLIKASLKVLNKADGIIHHYGNKFDEPFVRTRAIIQSQTFPAQKLQLIYPNVKQLDTCFMSAKTLKLSSNRLKTVAQALNCHYQKLDKGDGWPKWWMSYLKGKKTHDKQMREYCGLDVLTLAEISVIMRPYWPQDFLNRIYPKQSAKDLRENGRKCINCGSKNLKSMCIRVFNRKTQRNLQCQECGSKRNYEPVDL